jgi:hypothetical protein
METDSTTSTFLSKSLRKLPEETGAVKSKIGASKIKLQRKVKMVG